MAQSGGCSTEKYITYSVRIIPFSKVPNKNSNSKQVEVLENYSKLIAMIFYANIGLNQLLKLFEMPYFICVVRSTQMKSKRGNLIDITYQNTPGDKPLTFER